MTNELFKAYATFPGELLPSSMELPSAKAASSEVLSRPIYLS